MNNDVRRIAITGATGFIGSRLVDLALARGAEVVALVRNPEALVHLDRPGLSVKTWQFGAALPDLGEVDAVCHLAAFIPPNFIDPRQAQPCFELNAIGALHLAAQAADQGIGHFIYFSSGQVYAPGQILAAEDSPTYPAHRATYYLASKLAGELCVQALCNDRAVTATVLRLASVYGPGMHGKGMLPTYITRLSRNEPVTVMDGGSYSVDFVYVDDVVALAYRAVEVRASGVFNVGTGQARSSLEAAQIVAHAIGADKHMIAVEGAGARYGFAALDIAKASAQLSFKPRRLEEGLATWRETGQLTNFSK